MEDLKKMETHGKKSCEEILRKLHSLEDENEALNIENVKLKVVCVCTHLVAVAWSKKLLNDAHVLYCVSCFS